MAKLTETSNEQLLTQVREETANPMLRSTLAEMDLTDAPAVYNALSSMPSTMNALITELVNRCTMTQFFNKAFKNPLFMLHNGLLEYGTSIQQIFVDRGEKKGFQAHFETNGNSEKDLIGKRVPSANVDYIEKNFSYKYKVTTSEEQLKDAFLGKNGLGSMLANLILQQQNEVYIDEFKDMKGILLRETAENIEGSGQLPIGVVHQMAVDTTIQPTAFVTVGDSINTLAKKVKAYAGKLKFPTSKYNLSHINTWSNREDLVFITDPDTLAEMDVDMLMTAFNVQKGEVPVRTIEIDEFPTVKGAKIKGILMDKYLVQAWDTINTVRTFENGEGLYTNHFFHKQGIMASCKFAQCVVFTDKDLTLA